VFCFLGRYKEVPLVEVVQSVLLSMIETAGRAV